MELTKETHLHRMGQIAEVLSQHGLGSLYSALGLQRFALTRKPPSEHAAALTPPEHLRMALEELGATFVKLGQLLSTRADLLPPEYLAELSKLQDSVPPVPTGQIEHLLVKELGKPIDAAFASFDPKPLAAASIGQTHLATRKDHVHVVVKVQRPGVAEQVEEDLEILRNLAATASHHCEAGKQYDLIGLEEEFEQTIREELDYSHEARNAERFAANFEGDESVHIPRVFWDTSTARVLTLERISGIKVTDQAKLHRAHIDRAALAERGAQIVMKMIFEDGFFHADLHPGNFFVEHGGRVALIDFGMTGTLDEHTRDCLSDVIIAIGNRDFDQLTEGFLELGRSTMPVDRNALQLDLEHLIKPSYGKELKEIKLAPLLNGVFATLRRHYLHLPADLTLLLRSVIMAEGMGASLDPTFDLMTVIEPYAERMTERQYSPWRWLGKLGPASMEMARLSVALPQQMRRVLGDIERGNFAIGLRSESLEPFALRLENLANRLVLSILAGAFIVGSAVLLSFYHPQGWERWAGQLLRFGFLIATALSLYLGWRIARSHRK
jgi:ubiquinone biosynthesis protein